MSKHSGASYRPGDGIAHIVPGMSEERLKTTLTILECHFDMMCDKDAYELSFDERVRAHTMKEAVIKTLMFIPEMILTMLLHGVREAQARYEMQCLYWAFIRGKISEKDVADGYSVLALELVDRLKDS